MGNNRAIQILRSSKLNTNDSIKNEKLLDGQLFYSKKNRQLYIGDNVNFGTAVTDAQDKIISDGETNSLEKTLPIGSANLVPEKNGALRQLSTSKPDNSSYTMGTNAVVFGNNTKSIKNNQFVVGEYNDANTADNVLFVVGNGASEDARSNALEINKDGHASFLGKVEIGNPKHSFSRDNSAALHVHSNPDTVWPDSVPSLADKPSNQCYIMISADHDHTDNTDDTNYKGDNYLRLGVSDSNNEIAILTTNAGLMQFGVKEKLDSMLLYDGTNSPNGVVPPTGRLSVGAIGINCLPKSFSTNIDGDNVCAEPLHVHGSEGNVQTYIVISNNKAVDTSGQGNTSSAVMRLGVSSASNNISLIETECKSMFFAVGKPKGNFDSGQYGATLICDTSTNQNIFKVNKSIDEVKNENKVQHSKVVADTFVGSLRWMETYNNRYVEDTNSIISGIIAVREDGSGSQTRLRTGYPGVKIEDSVNNVRVHRSDTIEINDCEPSKDYKIALSSGESIYNDNNIDLFYRNGDNQSYIHIKGNDLQGKNGVKDIGMRLGISYALNGTLLNTQYGNSINFSTNEHSTNYLMMLKQLDDGSNRTRIMDKLEVGKYVNDSGSFTEYATIDSTGVTTSTFKATSDRRLKENIKSYVCEKSILDLPVYEFDYINGGNHTIGCMAQDLKEICPKIVSEDKDGYLRIEESKLVYLLLEEVKKLKKTLEEVSK